MSIRVAHRIFSTIGLAAALLLAGCGGGGSSGTAPPPPPGTLDMTFGNAGTVITPISVNAQANALAIQPDGKIVVAGSASDGALAQYQPDRTNIALARYQPNGGLDPTFGIGGIVVTPVVIDATNEASAASLALQSDGKIVVAGTATGFTASLSDYKEYCVLARYNPDGKLDPTFGVDGVLLDDHGGYLRSSCIAVAIQADGKLVVLMTSGPSLGIQVARFNADGSRDQSFGIDGVALAPMDPTPSPLAIAIQADGKIVAAARWSTGPGHGSNVAHFAVARVDANGNGDLAFGDGGVVTGTLPECCVDSGSVFLQQDGRTVVVVSSVVLRLLPSGALDPRFGVGGIATVTSSDPHAYVAYVAGALQAKDKIVLAGGGTYGEASRSRASPRRGILDSTFGDQGSVDTRIGELGGASAIAIQPDGRIVAAGTPGSLRVPPSPDLSLGQFKFGLVRDSGTSNERNLCAAGGDVEVFPHRLQVTHRCLDQRC